MNEEVRIVDVNVGRKPIAFEIDIECYAALHSWSVGGKVSINMHLKNKEQLESLITTIAKTYKDYKGVKEDVVKKEKKLSVWRRMYKGRDK